MKRYIFLGDNILFGKWKNFIFYSKSVKISIECVVESYEVFGWVWCSFVGLLLFKFDFLVLKNMG